MTVAPVSFSIISANSRKCACSSMTDASLGTLRHLEDTIRKDKSITSGTQRRLQIHIKNKKVINLMPAQTCQDSTCLLSSVPKELTEGYSYDISMQDLLFS